MTSSPQSTPVRKYHFISGLPRSGTTLFSTIISQNPKFQASISGPLARFTRAVIQESSSQGGYRFQCPEDKRKDIIRNMFGTYYNNPEKEVIFDTNRGWNLMTPLLKDLYPDSKIIVFVRDISWILDSFEQLVQKQPYSMTSMFNEDENTNVYSRANAIMSEGRTLGFAYTALKQALNSNESENILLVEYESLAKNPKKVMQAVYKFIGEPYFEHDYNSVEYTNEEFDNDVVLNNLHTTRKVVSLKSRSTILPKDLFDSFVGAEFWRDKNQMLNFKGQKV